MPKYAIEQVFNGSISVERGTYDPDKINLLGKHLDVYNLGSNDEDKFLGPKLTKIIRHSDISAPTGSTLHVLGYGNKHYIFIGIAPTAAATRQFATYVYDTVTEEISAGGLTTFTLPTTTAHTLRGIKPTLKFYTIGTVAVSGTTVTGSGTEWQTSRLCVGSRIGFGSTDSQQITTWYEISAIDSDTSITLAGSAGTITAGTSYVIEDLRIGMVTTNATLPNGGMFLAKGLRLDSLVGGLTVPAATTVDNIRAVYKLNDEATNTHTIASGLTAGEFVSWTEEYQYGVNNTATTQLKIYKYNIRADLTTGAGGLVGGVATLSSPSDVVVTGNQVITAGTLAITNNGRFATLEHGPGNNIPCLYITATNRLLRVDVADVLNNSTTFLKDQMIEATPGGIQSVPLIGALTNCDYSATLDKLIITGYTAPNGRIYVTDYKTDGSALDAFMGVVWNLFDSVNSVNPIFPKIQGQAPLIWAEDGVLYISNNGTSPLGQTYVYPSFGAHWSETQRTNNLAILPKITITNPITKLNRISVTHIKYIRSLPESEKTLEPYFLYYRTEGMDDNTGEWSPVPQSGSLSAIEPTSEIQFAFAFKTWGDLCIPSRICSATLIYEAEDALPGEYQWNLADSNTIDGTFGFTQTLAFDNWPKLHTIKIYRSDNNTLSLEQNSDGTTFGVFEYWDGEMWDSGLGDNQPGTRRRFRPTSSLPGGIDLYAVLSVTDVVIPEE
jgi:hypothetical protein